MTLEAKLEAVLFFKAEPLSIKELGKLLGASEEEIINAINELDSKLVGRGVQLMRKDQEVMLGTSPEASELIENIAKEELSRDLGKAGLETLAIILYMGPISRTEIDYIRGVNSSFIVRNLLIRGLIERTTNTEDARSYLYKPTMNLYSLLGITRIEDLPEWDSLREKINNFVSAQKEEDNQNATRESTINSN
jgi:segregation and condensation protein B